VQELHQLNVPGRMMPCRVKMLHRIWMAADGGVVVAVAAVAAVIVVVGSTDILPGQGLYYETLTQTYRVQSCSSNAYGKLCVNRGGV
jgi:hypothetical protein